MHEIQRRGLKELEISSLENEKQLQDWVEEYPNVLGTDFYGRKYSGYKYPVEKSWEPFQQGQKPSLLIIQREYGFDIDGADNRLDLLALDLDGRLVLIELKAGPAKKDIVAQSAVYRSYVKKLDTNKIIEIYQKYLDKWWPDEYDAEEVIREFLESYTKNGSWDKESDPLNKKQVVLLIAEKFHSTVFTAAKESLSKTSAYCFKIGIYLNGNKKFLTCNQVWSNKKSSS